MSFTIIHHAYKGDAGFENLVVEDTQELDIDDEIGTDPSQGRPL